MLRADQDVLLRWVLDALAADPADPAAPDGAGLQTRLADLGDRWPSDRFALAGLATGLTAAVMAVADGLALHVPDAWAGYGREQHDEVAARHTRFAEVLPRVLRALADADVGAVPVKGAVLVQGTWTLPAARPMADIDLLVAPDDRARAGDALLAAGFITAGRAPWEDTFLAWGDGSVGRRDGESRDHNGKVEVHPGWVERLHDYLVDDTATLFAHATPGTLVGAPCLRLSDAAFAAHVLGHLGACAIRGEVRAVNIVDAVLVLRRLDADGHRQLRLLADLLDPRPIGAALWLVGEVCPVWPSGDVDDLRRLATRRLPARARLALATTRPADVLRDPAGRTTFGWRRAWATHPHELAAVARQYVWPAAGDLAVSPGRSVTAARVRRVGRAARAGARLARRA